MIQLRYLPKYVYLNKMNLSYSLYKSLYYNKLEKEYRTYSHNFHKFGSV
jgi:hypothetical protein